MPPPEFTNLTEYEKQWFDNNLRSIVDEHLINENDYDRDHDSLSARVVRVLFDELKTLGIDPVPTFVSKLLRYYRKTSDVFLMERL